MTIAGTLPPLLQEVIPKTVRKREAREKHRRLHSNADVPGCRRCTQLRNARKVDWKRVLANRKKGIHPHGWADVENARLAELCGLWTPTEIAEILNEEFHVKNDIVRTGIAVVNQIKKQNLSRMMQGFRMHEVEAIFQFDHRGIHKHWLDPGLLVPTRTFPGRGPAEVNYVFTFEDMERFVREHHTAYDYRRIDPERVRRWERTNRQEVIDAARRLRIIAEQTWRADPYLTRAEACEYLGWKKNSHLGWDLWALRYKVIPFVRRWHSVRKGATGDGEVLVRAADIATIREQIDAEARRHMREGNVRRSQNKAEAQRLRAQSGNMKGRRQRVLRTHKCQRCGFLITRRNQPLPLHCPDCKKVAWRKPYVDQLQIEERHAFDVKYLVVTGGY